MTSAFDRNVVTAPPALRENALRMLMSATAPAERKRRAAEFLRQGWERDSQMFDNLLVALRKGSAVGAVWGRVSPGRTALTWPPELAAGEQEATADLLLRDLHKRLVAAGIQLSQAVVEPARKQAADRLIRNGYSHAATMLSMFRDTRGPVVEPDVRGFELESWDGSARERLRTLLEATYEGTLDVPALDGVRSLDDVLSGYEATGDHDPRRWFLVLSEGRDSGCLLLADHPATDQWELVYMGLVPSARGRRWGTVLAAKACQLARQAGRSRLVLAVDARNDPAIQAYARCGFQEWDRNELFLRVVQPA